MSKHRKSAEKADLIDKCDALYVWHKDAVYRMALAAVGGDVEWALRILEECMMTAYRDIDKFGDEKSDGSKSMMAAIFQGVINKIYVEVWRKMGINDENGKFSVSTKDRLDVNQILKRYELTADLAKYVDKLRNTEKELIFLRFYMGVGVDEIAERLEISREEADARIFLIKRSIAKMMMER